MIHLGDITKIDGHKVPLVDIVTGGSPCQDLSVAGKRKGLEGERSGLFMEQIRIIKEMRDESTKQLRLRGADVNIRDIKPRYMVWENVPGAFSSNNGEDFRCVLEEVCRIADKTANVPRPERGGWSKSGCIMGSDWSVAWRLHDAQFWGVPQRRKRIALVADFGGQSAPEILFERESVSGNPEKSSDKGQEIAGSVRTSTDPSSYTLKIRGGVEVDSRGKKAGKGALVQTELSGTLGVSQDQTLITNKCLNGWDIQSKHIQPESGKAEALYSGECRYGGGESYVMQNKVYGISAYESNAMKSANPNSGIYEADTSRTLDNNGGNPACNQGGMIVLEGNGSRPSHKGDGYSESEVSYTLNSVEQHGVCTYQQTTGTLSAGAHAGSYNGQDAYNDMLVVDGGGTEPVTASKASFFLNARSDGTADTLVATDYKDPQIVCYGLDRASFNQGRNAQYDFSVQEELAQPLVARGPGGY